MDKFLFGKNYTYCQLIGFYIAGAAIVYQSILFTAIGLTLFFFTPKNES